MKYIAVISTSVGLILALIWIIQEFSTVKLLDDPATGAIGFMLLGSVLSYFARKKTINN